LSCFVLGGMQSVHKHWRKFTRCISLCYLNLYEGQKNLRCKNYYHTTILLYSF
jgi:hypothetical protein